MLPPRQGRPGPPRAGAAPIPQLRVTAGWPHDRVLVLTLTGEVTVHRRDLLRRSLADAVVARPALLVVDLAGVGFCDSTVLNALLRTRVDARSAGVPLVLAGPPPQAVRLLRLARTEDVFTMRPTLRAALAVRPPADHTTGRRGTGADGAGGYGAGRPGGPPGDR